MRKFIKRILLGSIILGAVLCGSKNYTYAENVDNVMAEQEVTVQSLDVDFEYEGMCLKYTFTGSYCKLYINGVEQDTIYKTEDGNYDGFTWIKSYVPGVKYKITAVPYDSKGQAGEERNITKTSKLVSLGNVKMFQERDIWYGVTLVSTNNYNSCPKVEVRLSGNIENNCMEHWQEVQVYRATGKPTNKYEMVGVTGGYSSYSYIDSNVLPGKTYYYKFRTVEKKDETNHIEGFVGEFTKAYKFTIKNTPTPYVYATNTAEGVKLEFSRKSKSDKIIRYGAMSGYEIYRSTKKNGNYKRIAITGNLSYTDITAKPGKRYYYKVKAYFYDTEKKEKYYGGMSKVISVKTVKPNFEIESVQIGNLKMSISWDAVKDAKKYKIYYKAGKNSNKFIYLATTSDTNYIAKKLNSNANYTFRVRAFLGSEEGNAYYAQSESAMVKMGFGKVKNFRVTKKEIVTTDDIYVYTAKTTMKWDRVYGADGYEISALVDGEQKVVKTINNEKTTSYTFTNEYTNKGAKIRGLRIRALKGTKKSAATFESNNGIDGTDCPENLKIANASDASVRLTWDEVNGATSYIIRRIDSSGVEREIAETKSESFVDKKVTIGVTYNYEVIAMCNNCSLYPYSGSTITYTHKLQKPTITSIKKSKNGTVKLTWKKNVIADKYLVYRSTKKNGQYKLVGTTKTTNLSDKNVTQGKTYFYKIKVKTTSDVGINVTSEYSAVKKIKLTAV